MLETSNEDTIYTTTTLTNKLCLPYDDLGNYTFSTCVVQTHTKNRKAALGPDWHAVCAHLLKSLSRS